MVFHVKPLITIFQFYKIAMLENRVNKLILKERLANETFTRKTLSFYRYVNIENPVAFRDKLYQE